MRGGRASPGRAAGYAWTRHRRAEARRPAQPGVVVGDDCRALAARRGRPCGCQLVAGGRGAAAPQVPREPVVGLERRARPPGRHAGGQVAREALDDDGGGVGAEGRQVGRVEALARVEPVDVARGDPGVGVHRGEPQREDGGRDEHRTRHPPPRQLHAGGEQEHHHQAEPQLEAVDEDAQHGVAEGVLVERHPVQRTGHDGQGQHAQATEEHAEQEPVGRRGPRREVHGQADDDDGEERGDGELAEALVHVLGIGQAGRLLEVLVAAPHGRGLGDEEARRRARRRCRPARPTPTGGWCGGSRAGPRRRPAAGSGRGRRRRA